VHFTHPAGTQQGNDFVRAYLNARLYDHSNSRRPAGRLYSPDVVSMAWIEMRERRLSIIGASNCG
jgi:hypothetical protein